MSRLQLLQSRVDAAIGGGNRTSFACSPNIAVAKRQVFDGDLTRQRHGPCFPARADRGNSTVSRSEAFRPMWKKVIAPTALVSLLWIIVSCGTSYLLDQQDETRTHLLNKNRAVMQAAGAMLENLWRLQATLLESSEHLERGGKLQERFKAEAKRIEGAFERTLAFADENLSTPDERELTRKISANFSQYASAARELLAKDRLSKQEAAEAVDDAMHLARAVAQPCEDLSELAQQLATGAFERRDRLRGRVNMARITFIIIGPALGILLGLRVARKLHHSISEISVTLRGASGDLDQEIGLVEVYPSADLVGLPALQQQVQDVSARIKQVVEELQRTRREAVRAERLAAVGELAAGVAHEVRNPLTSVKLLIQTIERELSPGSSNDQRLQIVQQEIGRIETTIQELLDYARPPKLRRVLHDVRSTLRRALNLAAGRAQQSGVSIDERLGANPMVVNADPEQLHQVFINLILNAIEAMPEGGTLQVTVEEDVRASHDSPSPPAGRMLRISFLDTGGGIPPQVLERLFEPFVTSKERGIGLGLAISGKIVQEHGGRLTACNTPDGGAILVIEMPSADIGAAHDETGDSAPSGPALESFCGQTLENTRHR
jgi:two-component system sensor histidine kinase HydH